MKRVCAWTLATTTVLLVAAGFQDKSPEPKLENPEYKGWASCKVGSWIKMKEMSEAAGKKSESEIQSTLVELTADLAVLEVKTTVADKGAPAPKTERREIPARIKEDRKDSPKREADEDVRVGAKSFRCRVYCTTTVGDAGKTVTRVWMCADLPGGIAKMEILEEGAEKSSRVLTAFDFQAK